MTEIRWFGKVLSQEFKELQLIILSDLHYGNPYCSIKHFLRTVEFIRERPNCFAFLNGDLCEAAIRTSKGEIYQQVGSPDAQKKQVVEWLLPIKDKILAMTTGNHENRISDLAGTDISDYIAEKLEIPYRPEGMLYKLSFGDYNKSTKGRPFVFWIYITHGYGGARTKSAKAVKVERVAHWIDAHVYCMSHDHVVNAAPEVYLIPDNRSKLIEGFLSGKVQEKVKKLVKTNAYIKWGGYAETGGFSPSDLATPIISLLTPHSKQWEMYPEKPEQAVRVSV